MRRRELEDADGPQDGCLLSRDLWAPRHCKGLPRTVGIYAVEIPLDVMGLQVAYEGMTARGYTRSLDGVLAPGLFDLVVASTASGDRYLALYMPIADAPKLAGELR